MRRFPLDRRLGGPQSRSGSGDGEKISKPLPRLEPPIIQPVAQRYTTELFRLLSDSDMKINAIVFVFTNCRHFNACTGHTILFRKFSWSTCYSSPNSVGYNSVLSLITCLHELYQHGPLISSYML
jgi:hypothetical protein